MFLRDQSPLPLLFAIAAVLLLGAVLNVLVAWGLVCWRPPVPATTPAALFWPAEVPQDWPMPEEMHSARWIGFEYAYAYGSNRDEATAARREARLYAVPRKGEDSAGRLQAYEELAATLRLRWALLHSVKSGWPMLSMSCDERRFAARFYATGYDAAPPLHSRTGLDLPDWVPWCNYPPSESRRLPTRIIPAGFATNTLVYAAACALVLWAPRAIRRHCRRRAGHCPACNYDLRGGPHSLCPECGATCEVGP